MLLITGQSDTPRFTTFSLPGLYTLSNGQLNYVEAHLVIARFILQRNT